MYTLVYFFFYFRFTEFNDDETYGPLRIRLFNILQMKERKDFNFVNFDVVF